MSGPTLKARAIDFLVKTRRFLRRARAQFFIPAARSVGVTENGNHLVKLSRPSALGNRGAVLELPMDRMIFRNVYISGEWDSKLSHFLWEGLEGDSEPEEKSALLDIGANTGLVTLQTMNMATRDHDYFLFEPIPRHVSAIRRNLGTNSSGSKVHIIPVAPSRTKMGTQIFSRRLLIMETAPSGGRWSAVRTSIFKRA